MPAPALFREALERERHLQQAVVGRAFAPVDAVFDAMEETGAALREQAEAIEHAAVALRQAALLMKRQAELYERAVGTLRAPSRLVESVLEPAPPHRGEGRMRR
jgi:hypothetical protein